MGPWEMLGLASASAAIFLILAWLTLVLYRSARREPVPRRGEVSELRQRVAELEMQQSRVAELEERLDFAERLLAEQKAPEHLPRV